MHPPCNSGHKKQLWEMNLLQQREYSSRDPINLTLVCVSGDEHRNRIKLIAVTLLPTWHVESRVCEEIMMEDGNELQSKKKSKDGVMQKRLKVSQGGITYWFVGSCWLFSKWVMDLLCHYVTGTNMKVPDNLMTGFERSYQKPADQVPALPEMMWSQKEQRSRKRKWEHK